MKRLNPAGLAVSLVFALGAASSVGALQQEGTASRTGVFTTAQADRGRSAFQKNCSACHGPTLGGAEGPALVGDVFWQKWEGQTVDDLVRYVKTRMPEDDADSVADDVKLDIVALILDSNGFPAGPDELKSSSAGMAARIVGANGPQAPRNGALVAVVGCLAAEGAGWVLTESTAPVLTTLDAPAQRKNLDQAPSKHLTFGLLSVFPSPEANRGKRVRAIGLLAKSPDRDRINVVSLEVVAPTCAN
jgi:hypothetical protein